MSRPSAGRCRVHHIPPAEPAPSDCEESTTGSAGRPVGGRWCFPGKIWAAPPSMSHRATGRGRGVFDRIAVVNRGEPALRLTRAVRELNAELGTRTRVVALHTEAERRATFVRAADEAVLLGGDRGGRPDPRPQGVAPALRRSGARGPWGGWGVVAEDPPVAPLCP